MLTTIEHIQLDEPSGRFMGFVCFWSDGRAWWHDFRSGAANAAPKQVTHDAAIDLVAAFIQSGCRGFSLISREPV